MICCERRRGGARYFIGILAGPPDGDAERAAIYSACRELGPRLEYRGPLYGEAKQAFFRAVDVFVFPTRYANEAQPAVVFEALAHGVPVLSYDRGCIANQIGSCGSVQVRDAEFLLFALDWLKAHCKSPTTLAQLKRDACETFRRDQQESINYLSALFK